MPVLKFWPQIVFAGVNVLGAMARQVGVVRLNCTNNFEGNIYYENYPQVPSLIDSNSGSCIPRINMLGWPFSIQFDCTGASSLRMYNDASCTSLNTTTPLDQCMPPTSMLAYFLTSITYSSVAFQDGVSFSCINLDAPSFVKSSYYGQNGGVCSPAYDKVTWYQPMDDCMPLTPTGSIKFTQQNVITSMTYNTADCTGNGSSSTTLLSGCVQAVQVGYSFGWSITNTSYNSSVLTPAPISTGSPSTVPSFALTNNPGITPTPTISSTKAPNSAAPSHSMAFYSPSQNPTALHSESSSLTQLEQTVLELVLGLGALGMMCFGLWVWRRRRGKMEGVTAGSNVTDRNDGSTPTADGAVRIRMQRGVEEDPESCRPIPKTVASPSSVPLPHEGVKCKPEPDLVSYGQNVSHIENRGTASRLIYVVVEASINQLGLSDTVTVNQLARTSSLGPGKIAILSWRNDVQPDGRSRNLKRGLMFAKRKNVQYLLVDVIQDLSKDPIGRILEFSQQYNELETLYVYNSIKDSTRLWLLNELMYAKPRRVYQGNDTEIMIGDDVVTVNDVLGELGGGFLRSKLRMEGNFNGAITAFLGQGDVPIEMFCKSLNSLPIDAHTKLDVIQVLMNHFPKWSEIILKTLGWLTPTNEALLFLRNWGVCQCSFADTFFRMVVHNLTIFGLLSQIQLRIVDNDSRLVQPDDNFDFSIVNVCDGRRTTLGNFNHPSMVRPAEVFSLKFGRKQEAVPFPKRTVGFKRGMVDTLRDSCKCKGDRQGRRAYDEQTLNGHEFLECSFAALFPKVAEAYQIGY